MANIKISELNPLLTVEDADVLPIVDNAVTKKVTAAILRTYTEGNSVLLTGAQTVAGIKTFTSQLASSVATGTAPFSVASTTKVTNLNADLLDGLSSADFALSTRTLTAGTGLTGGGDLTANRTFAIDSTVATLTGTQTLTNKTLTSPIINEVLDSNGNEILGFTPIASATDYITIKNGIGVGVPVHISATGSSTNIGLHLEPKGSGLVQISDGTDTTKGIRFRSSGSATSAVTLIDAVSSAGRVITLPNATGTLALTSDLTAYVPTTRTVSTTSPIIGGGALSSDLTISIPQSSGSVNGYLSSTDFATFNAKQNAITLTTTGTSGAATLVGSTLNIPNYADTDTGITSLNGLTALTQTFATGTSGTDFGISSATSTHTFNLPTASATNRGALSSADWTTFNNKQNALTNPITGTGTTNYLPKFTGASALGNSLVYDSGSAIGIGTTTPGAKLEIKSTALASEGLRVDGDGGGFAFVVKGGTDYTSHIRAGATIGVNYFTTPPSNGLIVEGSVGIGTTTPAAKLDVVGSVKTNDRYLWGTANNGTTGQIVTDNTNNYFDYLGTLFFRASASSATRLTLAESGAATFSSSVTTGGDIILGDYATATTKVLDLRTSNSLFTIATDGTAGGLGTTISYSWANGGQGPLKFNNAAGEVMRLSSNGNVNIGTTYNGRKLNIGGSAYVDMVLKSTSASGVAGGGTLYFGNSADEIAYVNYDHASNYMSFATNNSEKMRITSAGGVILKQGISLSDATVTTSGIEFPATQVASASANNLDDYEEGTFTMGIAFGGASVGVTYLANTGTYTKIGRQVTVNGFVYLSSKGSSTGTARVTGLPFTIGNSGANLSAPSLNVYAITFGNQIQGLGDTNQTTIVLEQVSALGTVATISNADFANDSYIVLSFTYFV